MVKSDEKLLRSVYCCVDCRSRKKPQPISDRLAYFITAPENPHHNQKLQNDSNFPSVFNKIRQVNAINMLYYVFYHSVSKLYTFFSLFNEILIAQICKVIA